MKASFSREILATSVTEKDEWWLMSQELAATVTALSAVLALVLTAATAFIALRALLDERRKRLGESLAACYRYLDRTAEHLAALRTARANAEAATLRELFSRTGDQAPSLDAQHHHTRVLSEAETLASGVLIGAHSIEVIDGLLGSHLLYLWDSAEPLVGDRRKFERNEHLYESLQTLATMLDDIRCGRGGRATRLGRLSERLRLGRASRNC